MTLCVDTLGHVCRFLALGDVARLGCVDRALRGKTHRIPRLHRALNDVTGADVVGGTSVFDDARLDAFLRSPYVRHLGDEVHAVDPDLDMMDGAPIGYACPIGATLDRMQRVMRGVPRMRALSVAVADVAPLVAFETSPASLTELRVCVDVTTHGCEVIRALLVHVGRMRQVRTLHIVGHAPDTVWVNRRALYAFMTRALAPLHTTLESLRIDVGGGIVADDANPWESDASTRSTLAWLASMPRLHHLDFIGGCFVNSELRTLAEGVAAPRLTYLNLANTQVSASVPETLARFASLTELHVRYLVPDVDLACVGRALTSLRLLMLGSLGVRAPIHPEHVLGASLTHFGALEGLHLYKRHLTSDMLGAAVRAMPHLHSLALGAIPALRSLAFLRAKRDTLQNLALISCADVPHEEHAAVLQLHRLTSLHLVNTLAFGQSKWEALLQAHVPDARLLYSAAAQFE